MWSSLSCPRIVQTPLVRRRSSLAELPADYKRDEIYLRPSIRDKAQKGFLLTIWNLRPTECKKQAYRKEIISHNPLCSAIYDGMMTSGGWCSRSQNKSKSTLERQHMKAFSAEIISPKLPNFNSATSDSLCAVWDETMFPQLGDLFLSNYIPHSRVAAAFAYDRS